MKLWQFIKNNMLTNPNQIISENNTEMTYKEVVIFSEVFSGNIKNELCCAIACQSEMMEAIAILSCFAADVTAVPISIRYGKQHYNKILDKISPSVVISDTNGRLQVIPINDYSYTPPRTHPALIMCTSGTTGSPKGVMLSEDNLISNVTDICSYFNISSQDTMLIARPLYHCAVLTGEFLTGLTKGCNIHFCSEQFNPLTIFNIMAARAITVFCATPTLFGLLARLLKTRTDINLKHIAISGECMSIKTGLSIAQAFPDADIYHVYGLTEAGPRVSYLPPEQFLKNPDSVGIPLNSVSVKIINSYGHICNMGEEGILWLRSPSVMTGYYNDDALTNKVIQNGWLCTGDIAFIDNNGYIRLKGRNDDMIIRSGMNIYPQEVENVLKTDSRVNEVLIYGFKDSRDTTQIGMKISGDFSDIIEVKTLCSNLLPKYQFPAHIELLDELPKNGSGKIIRKSKDRIHTMES